MISFFVQCLPCHVARWNQAVFQLCFLLQTALHIVFLIPWLLSTLCTAVRTVLLPAGPHTATGSCYVACTLLGLFVVPSAVCFAVRAYHNPHFYAIQACSAKSRTALVFHSCDSWPNESAVMSFVCRAMTFLQRQRQVPARPWRSWYPLRNT